jgi:hypothetical protein
MAADRARYAGALIKVEVQRWSIRIPRLPPVGGDPASSLSAGCAG